MKIYEYVGGLLHTKSLTVDGEVTLIGSANIDRRSFELNFENNILFVDRALTADDARAAGELHRPLRPGRRRRRRCTGRAAGTSGTTPSPCSARCSDAGQRRKISAIPATTSTAPAQAPAPAAGRCAARAAAGSAPARSPRASRRSRPCRRPARRAAASSRPRARGRRSAPSAPPTRGVSGRAWPHRRRSGSRTSTRQPDGRHDDAQQRGREGIEPRRHHRPRDQRAERLPGRRAEPGRDPERRASPSPPPRHGRAPLPRP